MFAPLNVAAFLYIPKELRGAAVGLLALLRNEGGSVGTSVAQTSTSAASSFTRCGSTRSSTPFIRPRPAGSSGGGLFMRSTGDRRPRTR